MPADARFLRFVALDLLEQEQGEDPHVLPIAQPGQQLVHERLDTVGVGHVYGSVGKRVKNVQACLSHLLGTTRSIFSLNKIVGNVNFYINGLRFQK